MSFTVSSKNQEIIIQSLRQLGGSATNREVAKFLTERYVSNPELHRNGRPWSEHYVQRDMHYLKEKGAVIAVMEDRRTHRERFYLPESLTEEFNPPVPEEF